MTRTLSSQLAPAALRARTLSDAYRACMKLCRAHYENFPVASLWLPAEERRSIAVIYAFARVADDFADEPGWTDAERLNLLADWRRRLHGCRTGHDQHPLFWALADTTEKFSLPLDPFDRLITAFEMDVTVKRYPTFEKLLNYCHHSADPVGELVLRVFREWDEKRQAWSNAICTALQLANFWQDVTVDALKDRVYVPLADLEKFGVSVDDVLRGPVSDRLTGLIRFQVVRTRGLFDTGRPLCDVAPSRLKKELRLVWLGGTGILQKIQDQNHDVWLRRPILTKRDWFRLLPRLFFWKPSRAGAG